MRLPAPGPMARDCRTSSSSRSFHDPSRLARTLPKLGTDRVALLESGLIASGFALLFFCLPHGLAGDDSVRFDDIERLLHHGELTDGRYSLAMPLFSAPFLLVGQLAGPSEEW